MNVRERFLGVLNYEQVDEVPDLEMGFWEGALERWRQEGMPEHVKTHEEGMRFFGFGTFEGVKVDIFTIPSQGPEQLEETDEHRIYKDEFGNICKTPKKGHTIPHYVKYVIESREDWERLKPLFDPAAPGRYPADWEERKEAYAHLDVPLYISVVSLFGWLRSMMGVERCCIAFAEDRPFIEDIQETLTAFYMKLYGGVLEQIGRHVDFAGIWEDMCYNKGPLISPMMYAQTAMPRYKRITSMFHDYGINLVRMDCDGKIDELVPLWLEAGINIMWPLEAAHTNGEALRAKHGRRLRIMGGIDKRALARGERDIDSELARIERLMRKGGVIPHVDHGVPEDVSYGNFCYYVKKKREMLTRVPDEWEA
jgi:uroporphyrinogen decarboxylase